MSSKILTMLRMQDDMNKKVHTDWQLQGFDWYRAVWTECAELMDHYGWKWWKKQQPDIEQVKLELVDIWHFGLSIIILEKTVSIDTSKYIQQQLEVAASSANFREQLESFAESTLTTKSFSVNEFSHLLNHMDMNLDDLYRSYVGKNVLNFFRQDNGYKDGTYIKTWDGREDNEHLVEIINDLDSESEKFKDEVYEKLKARYMQLNM